MVENTGDVIRITTHFAEEGDGDLLAQSRGRSARVQIQRGTLLEWMSRVLVEVREGGRRARAVQVP